MKNSMYINSIRSGEGSSKPQTSGGGGLQNIWLGRPPSSNKGAPIMPRIQGRGGKRDSKTETALQSAMGVPVAHVQHESAVGEHIVGMAMGPGPKTAPLYSNKIQTINQFPGVNNNTNLSNTGVPVPVPGSFNGSNVQNGGKHRFSRYEGYGGGGNIKYGVGRTTINNSQLLKKSMLVGGKEEIARLRSSSNEHYVAKANKAAQNISDSSLNTQNNGISAGNSESVRPLTFDATNKDSKLSNEEKTIIIHVFDEAKKVRKDFKCDKFEIVEHMKYFSKYIEGNTSLDDIDISVHCDIHIFDWLLNYIKNPKQQEAKLHIKDVISILISSDFLQMATLTTFCIKTIQNNILEVVRLPIDMSCVSSKLLKRIVHKLNIDVLDELKDRKDKLISKLYMKKLEKMFEKEENMLYKCEYCNELFTESQKQWMTCPKANIFIDFHGNVIAEHLRDPAWDINHFITFLRKQALSWREIYWKIWSRLMDYKCSICDNMFIASYYSHCSFHPKLPSFLYGQNTGIYPCCQLEAKRFDTINRHCGCTTQPHKLNNTSDGTYQLIETRLKIIGEPFLGSSSKDSEHNRLLEASNKNPRLGIANSKYIHDALPLSKLKDSIPLSVLVNKFELYSTSYPYNRFMQEDEDSDLDGTTAESFEKNRKFKDKKGIINKQKKNTKQKDVPYTKLKKWRMDKLRSTDRIQMKVLQKKLKKVRVAEETKIIEKKGKDNKRNLILKSVKLKKGGQKGILK